jgi:hypothetical protein
MNFMVNLFLIGAASGEPAGRLSRVKRSRWFILAGAITAAALMAALLAPANNFPLPQWQHLREL